MAGAGGVFASEGVVVVMDPASLIYAKVFHTGSGPDRHIRKKAEAVAFSARSIVPRRTGRLLASIAVDQNRDEKGNFSFGFRVSAATPYVVYVHEGTGPSPRWPTTRKNMKFAGRDGTPVYRDFVMHPGTPANPFLRDALAAMVG